MIPPTFNEDLDPALAARNEEIRQLYRDGWAKKAIARQVGLTRGAVQYVLRGGTTTKARNRAIAQARYGVPT